MTAAKKTSKRKNWNVARASWTAPAERSGDGAFFAVDVYFDNERLGKKAVSSAASATALQDDAGVRWLFERSTTSY
jgi:hypothetical protein